MRKFAVFFLFINSINLFSQNPYNLQLGEIYRIDNLTGTIEVKIYQTNLEESFRNKTIDRLVVFSENKSIIGEIQIKSFYVLKKEIVVRCISMTPEMRLYAGQSIGLVRQFRPAPELHDKFPEEKINKKEIINLTDSSPMILIDEGPFIFGSDIPGTNHYTSPIEYELTEIQKDLGKKRVRYLHMNSFYIDKYEITMGQFKKYLQETASDSPPDWNPQSDPAIPVSNLSFTMAEAYCKWASKRLPTELEWEKAARGPGILTSFIKDDIEFFTEKINIYPTGLEFNPEVCITEETSGILTSVNDLKDKNYYGLYGTCGNAAEWTSSWLLPYRGNSRRNPDFGRKFKVIRGGAYNLPTRYTKAYERMAGGLPTLSSDFRAGVRCVKDPQQD